MNVIGKVADWGSSLYSTVVGDVNQATLSGAIDIIAVEQGNGELSCTPFHVRFGKLQVLRSREKVVEIVVNGEVADFHMKLGIAGDAFFVVETEEILGSDRPASALLTSPIASPDVSHIPDERNDGESILDPWVLSEKALSNYDTRWSDSDDDVDSEADTVTLDGSQSSGRHTPQGHPTEMKKTTPKGRLRNIMKLDSSSTFPITTRGDNIKSVGISAPRLTRSRRHSAPVPLPSISDMNSKQGSGWRWGWGDFPIHDDRKQFSMSPARDLVVMDIEGETKIDFKSGHTTSPDHPDTNSPSFSSENMDLEAQRDFKENGEENPDIVKPRVKSDRSWVRSLLRTFNWRSKHELDQWNVVENEDPVDAAMSETFEISRSWQAPMVNPTPRTMTSTTLQEGISHTESVENVVRRRRLSLPNVLPASVPSVLPVPDILVENLGEDFIESSDQFPPSGTQRSARVSSFLAQSSATLTDPPECLRDQTDDPNSSLNVGLAPGLNLTPEQVIEVDMDSVDRVVGFDEKLQDAPTPIEPDDPVVIPETPSITRLNSRGKLTFKTETPPNGSVINDVAPTLEHSSEENIHSVSTDILAENSVEKDASEESHISGEIVDSMPAESKLEESSSNDQVEIQIQDMPDSSLSVHNGAENSEKSVTETPKTEFTCTSIKLPEGCVCTSNMERKLSLLSGDLMQCDSQDTFERMFLENVVSYDVFCQSPRATLSDPRTVFCVQGHLMTWTEAQIMFSVESMFSNTPVFNPVPYEFSQEGWVQKPEQIDESRAQRTTGGWFWFGRRKSEKSVAPPPEINNKDGKENVENSHESPVENPENEPTIDKEDQEVEEVISRKLFMKVMRPTSEQLHSLNLKDGPNEVVFRVIQDKTEVKATIYKWARNSRVVVSDIDGTITKSDLLGQLLPTIGKDWSHHGVAELFQRIAKNGYKMIYLSSRAIGQASQTREYLSWVKQENTFFLPEGPLLVSPDRLVQSFTREVIRRRPEEFKIMCLRDIRSLFGEDNNPFYAGFGNRNNDVISYRSVGIPLGRIFVINAQGEIRVPFPVSGYHSSYKEINELVDEIFPHIRPEDEIVKEQFNSFYYWKTPIPNIIIPDDDIPDYVNDEPMEEEEEEEEQSEEGHEPEDG